MTVIHRFPNKATILVVDDEYSVRDALVGMLEIEGYSALSCENGQAALDLMQQHRPDIVVTDFMMPRMSGLELAVEMKARRALHDIPVFLVSGAHAALAERQSPLFTAILEKPYRAETLLALIARHLRADASASADSAASPRRAPLQAARSS
ncbi:response regulator [Robbsia sp. KACC 23696]|uniref:response regulator n=1 Tax=Robbsia sp. KACC 23696 TaxID=3149231 RepID=UPI00325B2552